MRRGRILGSSGESTLKHPNIVSLKGFCFEPYTIIMEYMDLGSLTSFLYRKKKIEWNVQLKLALDIARGMEFLHGTAPPLVHRDLKILRSCKILFGVLLKFQRTKNMMNELMFIALESSFGRYIFFAFKNLKK